MKIFVTLALGFLFITWIASLVTGLPMTPAAIVGDIIMAAIISN